ncbi:PQQ-dependent sugar dehydrogenase [Rhodopseudomonas palustris]|uniref:PQQ-dependent sugar dehydrogenase n=1 Tax=Rhodopseudomonas palustris TaxID=1076 RepID=UPI0021F2E635|nr:sorbosone dehydrogenase family protein [Rhodopseudomonas palustris]
MSTIMFKRTVTLVACVSLLTLAGCGGDDHFDVSSQIGPNPNLPEPQQYLFPPMKLAPVVGWKDGETPSAPEGLKVAALATGLQHPRELYVLPNGDVLVVESTKPPGEPIKRPKDLVMGWVESFVTSGGSGANQPSNRITLLRDANGDGVPEVRSTFLDHLNSPFGVALVGNDLYVANTDAIMHYTYHPGDTQISEPGTVLTPLPGGPIDHHWTKSLVASRDGTLLYVGVGSNSNITENGLEAEKNRAAIWEVDRASGRWRLFATGLRNPNGLSIEPQTGALWTVVNERDELGPNLVPDYMTSVKDGGFYGWPYSYYGQHVDPRVQPQRPDLVAKAIVPDYALSSHVAPLGMAFATGTSLPAKYRGGAFVGEHGSWDRQHFNGYKVVYVPFDGGKPNGKAEDVVTGFLDPSGKARGRPVGVAIDKSGALLIADDVGNTVWRVTATDATPQTAGGAGTTTGAAPTPSPQQ